MIKHYAIDVSGGIGIIGELRGKLSEIGCRNTELSQRLELYYCGDSTVIMVEVFKDTMLIDIVNPLTDELVEDVLRVLPPRKTMIRILERGFT
ncbi:hypothetical protein [Desulfurococcus amylolyticus]|uniref:Uncharacterized protein n=1 Tax=Desulfurococcus amylolyticus DSM 16532 TaxID=768672 RepID=I3XSX1_DESAM|nr:hypothetical protein [Desulfurococcus amylolyticus]AFL67045.1 hypothetical protein Desfe_1175 [Desulfurococcus amylolyticus DSM 16532]